MPLFVQSHTFVSVAVVAAEHDGDQSRRRVWLRKHKMAEAEFQMHRETGELVLWRNQAGNRRNHAGMLLKGVLQTVSRGGNVHFNIQALVLRLEQTERALLGLECLGGKRNPPVTLFVAEMRIHFIGL